MKNTDEYTLTDLRRSLKKWGWRVKRDGESLIVTPHKFHGTDTFTTPDTEVSRLDMRLFAREKVMGCFQAELEEKIDCPDLRDALADWFLAHGLAWVSELFSAWFTGNYGSRFAPSLTSATLQRWRNKGGHLDIRNKFSGYNVR